MDPTLLAGLSAAGGTCVTAIISVFGLKYQQGKHEARLDAYQTRFEAMREERRVEIQRLEEEIKRNFMPRESCQLNHQNMDLKFDGLYRALAEIKNVQTVMQQEQMKIVRAVDLIVKHIGNGKIPSITSEA